MSLKNKSILVTGGSRGLGRAIAVEAARRGARVVLTSRNSDEARAVQREIESEGGIAFALASDISEKRDIYPLVAQASELAGPVDILINNASTLGPVPLQVFTETECEDFEKALATNVLGPFRLIKAVLGSMLVRGAGLVINISSDAAVSAYPAWGAYSVSKAGLDHMTRIWAEELSGTAIRIFSVDPGEMDTRMHDDAIPDADPATLADPASVAKKLLDLASRPDREKSGSRIILSQRA